ncbi:Kiwa anti-phage protein KwaB-like domain-containing protein [Clostridium sporogenes]|uniref:Kiwa anti-phage protein KwaB-like domain-containing protein n=1 Tax=Clostridium sporogenes TaxID=1509 RepID=UPI000665BE49|nr:Kiwa anti-phage protein KwaB-like domain-containing protein [Clostridium sporogenes]
MFNLGEVRTLLGNRDNFDLDCLFMSKDYKLKKVLLTDELKKDLISNLIEKFIYITGEKTVEEYDPIVKLDDKVPSIGVSDVGNLYEIIDEFNDIEVINEIDSIEETKDSKAYVLILKKEQHKVIFFKRFSSSNYLKRKLKIFFNDGRLKKLNKDILSIDDKFDCVVYEDFVAIFNQYYFEQIFDYKDEYTKKANENIDKIRSLDLIKNIDLMEKDCKKITIKKKISKITTTNIIWFNDKMKNDIERIKLVISEAKLDMIIENNKVVANDTSELIHLIQNDYLTSKISQENFVADKKTKI